MRERIKKRTKVFALDLIKLVSELPRKQELQVIGKQLIRSSSSVGANYRSACRAKSRADFISKLSIVEEEADETLYWLEILEELDISRKEEILRLKDEANQLISIIVASKKTARNHCDS